MDEPPTPHTSPARRLYLAFKTAQILDFIRSLTPTTRKMVHTLSISIILVVTISRTFEFTDATPGLGSQAATWTELSRSCLRIQTMVQAPERDIAQTNSASPKQLGLWQVSRFLFNRTARRNLVTCQTGGFWACSSSRRGYNSP